MFGRIFIRKHERGLWFTRGEFRGVLKPGRRFIPEIALAPWRHKIDRVDTYARVLAHHQIDQIMDDEKTGDELAVVALKDNERAIVWFDGRFLCMIGPGRCAFWRSGGKLAVETFEIDEFEFQHVRREVILAQSAAQKYLKVVDAEPHQEVLVYKDGVLIKRISGERFVYWQGAGRVKVEVVDKREQVLDVAGQEIMTQDKVTLRINLVVVFTIINAVKATTVSSNASQALYREAQLALRAAVGGRSLDALLADKEAMSSDLKAALRKRASVFGVEVSDVGLRDIILPGDMKMILNQVIEAEKRAQANLIRRREETAAARSQANTARLLADNPTLARIKELEQLADILAGVEATFVFGGGDIASQVKSLVASKSCERGS